MLGCGRGWSSHWLAIWGKVLRVAIGSCDNWHAVSVVRKVHVSCAGRARRAAVQGADAWMAGGEITRAAVVVSYDLVPAEALHTVGIAHRQEAAAPHTHSRDAVRRD
jgi:hypothetical protein